MTPWKLPPKEKIYEAFSVLADNRYEIGDDNSAKVTSSAGDKHYSVKWHEDRVVNRILISSNDNASRWQGYAGYPIIAILMILGILHVDQRLLHWFTGIAWNTLNKKHKNDYAKVVDIILTAINPEERKKILQEVDLVYEQLASLNLFKFTA